MSIVKINAISVPPQAGEELERRFAERQGTVDDAPGFEGFQLLRPTKGDDRYFVITTWASEEDFKAWASGPAKAAHSGPHSGEGKKPVATGADLLEFEVVDLDAVAGQE